MTESIVLETCAYERCVLVMVVRDRLTLTALLSCDLMVVVSDNYWGGTARADWLHLIRDIYLGLTAQTQLYLPVLSAYT